MNPQMLRLLGTLAVGAIAAGCAFYYIRQQEKEAEKDVADVVKNRKGVDAKIIDFEARTGIKIPR